jgi:TPP-dependent pyruvate/acetoin dehydrogenase alpha subunit
VVNRFKPLNKEHQFRVNELTEKYRNKVLPQVFEEKSTIQQAQGAARPIHGWSGETAAKAAAQFDGILDYLIEDIKNNPYVELTSASRWKARRDKKLNRQQRGKGVDSILGEEQDPFDLLTGEINLPPKAAEEVDAPATNAPESIEAEQEDVVDETPPTPEELFQSLMADREKRSEKDSEA